MDTTVTVSVGTFVLSCFATTIGVIVSVSFLTFNLFHRHKRFMKMSSPNLNILISIGGILLNIACLMYGMDYFFAERYGEATVTCQLRLWMIVFAVTLVFGPIFAKSWRVYKIFRNASVKKVVIKDNRLFMFCGILLCLDATILLLWQVVDLLESKRVTVLMKGPSMNISSLQNQVAHIQECSCDKVYVWLSLLFIWKSLVFSYGLYVAWKTRNILLPPMKDSPSIIISVVFTMFSSSLLVVLSSFLRHDQDAVYVLHILAITICGTVVQISVFLPKVIHWWKNPIENTVRLSTSIYEYGDHSEEEMYQLIAENRALKKTLNEKTSRLSKLENNLEKAKGRLKSISEKDFKFDAGLDVDLSEYKLDSGLDVDLSETTSTEDNTSRVSYHTNINPDTRRVIQDRREHRNSVYIANNVNKKALKRSRSDIGRVASFRQKRSRTSMCSLQTYYRTNDCFLELRESQRSKSDLVGSVAKSYNLEDNEDTLSYVSSYLPLKRTRRKLQYAIREDDINSSPENTTTLSNDQLYPSFEDYNSDTIVGKSSTTVILNKLSSSKPKRHKKQRTPKPSYEKTIDGDKTVVRKCYYL